MLNKYSSKISRDDAKKIKLEETYFYKNNERICNNFIKIINSREKIKLAKDNNLHDNFLFSSATEFGKIYKKMYEEYANIQNQLLNEIAGKMNLAGYN